MTQVIKPPIRGLAYMGGPPPAGYTNIRHQIMTVFASEVWPTATSILNPAAVHIITFLNSEISLGHTDPSSPTIQSALAALRAGGRGLAKFRVLFGEFAPDWMKRVNGFAPILCSDGGTVGPFWRTDYLDIYAALMGQFAARYDADWLVAEVAITGSNAGTTGELMIRPQNDPLLAAALLEYGVVAPVGTGVGPAVDQAAIQYCIDAHLSYWRFTPGSMARSPLHFTDGVNWDTDQSMAANIVAVELPKWGLLFRSGHTSASDPLQHSGAAGDAYTWGDLFPAQMFVQTVATSAMPTATARIGFSHIDFTSGTYQLSYGGASTDGLAGRHGPLNWNDDPYAGVVANAPIVAAALNSLPAIIAEGGVTVQTRQGTQAYTVTWKQPEARGSTLGGTSSLAGPSSPYTISEAAATAQGTLLDILSQCLGGSPHSWPYCEIHQDVDDPTIEPKATNLQLAPSAGSGPPAATVTYIGAFTDPSGAARKGTLTFTPVATIDAISGAILVQQDQIFTLDANGKLNGNTGVTLQMQTAYYVTVRFAAAGGPVPNTLVLLVPGYGTTIDLSTYSPL